MDYISEFKPRPQTVTLHDALAMELDQLDRRIKTSNNIPTKTLAEHLMVILLGMHQWITSQGQDIADYAQAVAGRMEGEAEGGLDESDLELLAAVCDHLEAVQKLFDEYKSLMPENVVALGQRNKELFDGLTELVESAMGEGEGEEGGGGEGEEDDALFDDAEEPEAEVIK